MLSPPIPAEAAQRDRYWEVEARLSAESEELWGLFCYEHGATGALWVAQGAEGSVVRHYFDVLSADAARDWPAAFRRRFPGAAPPAWVRVQSLPVEDWGTQWQAHFEPLAVGRRLMVCPPWNVPGRAAREGRHALVILPGQGFGTGRHASTAAALALVEKVAEARRPARVLDVGIGSGILALAACLLGGGEAWGVDIDAAALPEVRRNFRLNGLPAPRLVRGMVDGIAAAFPLVVANITAPVLTGLRRELVRVTEPEGHLVLSGVLAAEAPALVAAYEALGMESAEVLGVEDWVACRFVRPKA